MKKYAYTPINEVSINRILSHGAEGFVILSANRSAIYSENENCDLSEEYEYWLRKEMMQDDEQSQALFLKNRNKQADTDLMHDIQSRRYSYTPIFDGYHGTDAVVDDFEPSYIVYNHYRGGSLNKGNFEDLRDFAIDLCKKYKQDSVYIQAPNEAPIYVDCNGNQVNSSSTKNFKIDRDEMFYSTNKRDKSNPRKFTADIQCDESVNEARLYCYKDAPDFNTRVRRIQLGEIFVNK